jgi:hypothetical protein
MPWRVAWPGGRQLVLRADHLAKPNAMPSASRAARSITNTFSSSPNPRIIDADAIHEPHVTFSENRARRPPPLGIRGAP